MNYDCISSIICSYFRLTSKKTVSKLPDSHKNLINSQNEILEVKFI